MWGNYYICFYFSDIQKEPLSVACFLKRTGSASLVGLGFSIFLSLLFVHMEEYIISHLF